MTKRLNRGEVSAESAIILPVILGIIWLVVQAAV
ncbi:MAG: pilus assembly protein, partial [Actinobacteria bacterium]|nr:pilus assembly protein [Actinomycetota bacterium]